MFVFIPKGLFDGFSSNSLVYLFAKHGAYSAAFRVQGGFEEWATGSANLNTFVYLPVPEPSGTILISLGIFAVFGARRRV